MRRVLVACLACSACGGGGPHPGELLAPRTFVYMAADGAAIYGSSGDATVQRIDLASRAVTTVVDLGATLPAGGVVGIALVGDSMYLGYSSNLAAYDAVLVVPKGGGTASAVALNETQPFGLLADPDRLYWQTNGRTPTKEIRTLLRSGGTPETLATSTNQGWSVAVGDDALYWANENGIMRAPKSDLAHPQTIYPGNATSLAVDSTTLYFLGRGGPSAMPKAGGAVRTIAGTILNARFVADDLGLYAIATEARFLPDGPTRVVDGEVVRLPTYFGGLFRLDGQGRADVVADAIAHPWGVALDSSYVYWSVDGIYRVAR